MLKDIGAGLVSNIQQSLGRGMTPWGDAMKPLKYRKGVPLNDTRQHIYNRITHRLTGQSAVDVGILDSARAKIGRVHQYGATIHHPEHSRTLYFRVNKKTGVSRFAKKKRSNLAQNVTVPAYDQVIPARPFLPIRFGRVDMPDAWRDEILDQIKAHIEKALRP